MRQPRKRVLPPSSRAKEQGTTRDTQLEQLDLLCVKHADEWVRTLENWFGVYRNPVFAWMALEIHLDPRRTPQALPRWLSAYLVDSASSLLSGIFGLKPSDMPKLIGQVLGLSAPTHSIIGDALTLWTDPVLVGRYESLIQQPPAKGSAQRAREIIRDEFKLQSAEAVRQRLIEARKTVRALLAANGDNTSDKSVRAHCLQVLQVRLLTSRLLDQSVSPELTPQGFRAMLNVPPNRRGVSAALMKVNKSRVSNEDD